MLWRRLQTPSMLWTVLNRDGIFREGTGSFAILSRAHTEVVTARHVCACSCQHVQKTEYQFRIVANPAHGSKLKR